MFVQRTRLNVATIFLVIALSIGAIFYWKYQFQQIQYSFIHKIDLLSAIKPIETSNKNESFDQLEAAFTKRRSNMEAWCKNGTHPSKL